MMYRVYLAMKERSDQISSDEVAIASGTKVLDMGSLTEWLGKYEKTSTTIQSAFKKQVAAAAVSCSFIY
jgi:hypothetical protein